MPKRHTRTSRARTAKPRGAAARRTAPGEWTATSRPEVDLGTAADAERDERHALATAGDDSADFDEEPRRSALR